MRADREISDKQQGRSLYGITVACLLSIGLVLLFTTPVQSLERVFVRADQERIPLGEHLSYLEDRDAIWSLADVRSNARPESWQRTGRAFPAFGYTDSAYWFAVEIENLDALGTDRLVEIAYPVLDSVELYVHRDGQNIEHFRTGDRQGFAQRPVDHRHFVFPVSLAAHETITLYCRVQTSSALQIPITFWSERAFWVADQWALLGQGLYFGLMLVMILYNSFIYTVVRDRGYLFYVLFVGCFTLLQLTLHGVAYQYVWPAMSWLNEKILAASVSGALAFGGFFTITLLSLRTTNAMLYRSIALIAALGVVNALASLVVPYTTAMFVSFGLTILICLLSLVAGVTRWRQDYTPARYYTVAWIVLLVGSLIYVLNKVGAVPRNLLTENIMQVGSALEVVLLSFALAERINVARREAVASLGKYQALYENAIEGIFQTTLEYQVVSANGAMATVLGAKNADQLIVPKHTNLSQFFADERAADAFFHLLREEEYVIAYECKVQRSDGHEVWGSWSAKIVYDQNGVPLHYEGSLVDVTERRRAEEQIRRLAYYDDVTGLANRALLGEHLKLALNRAQRSGHYVAVLLLDLNRFKLVNDTMGHQAGDELLALAATRLTDEIRGSDRVARTPSALSEVAGDAVTGEAVARLGGDEFVMLLSDLHRTDDVALVARRVGDALSQAFTVQGKEVYVSASIGISLYPLDGEDSATLLKHADAAMYHAKKHGSGYEFYAKHINESAAKRLSLEGQLRTGLEQNQFTLHFQPRLDLRTGAITGCEALCRWQTPEHGIVPPSEFIPIAEESGLIVDLGEWVLLAACTQNKVWQRSGAAPLRVSVNLSARQLSQPAFVQTVKRILEISALAPEYLEVELTESILMADMVGTKAVLAELKRLGVYVSIDDFGTGYSSLSYLKHLPIDALKIDRSFIQGIVDDADSQAITDAIISMAQRLRLCVVAEGIETQAQLDYLSARGCDEVQGYLIGAPAESADFQESVLVQENTRTARANVPANKASLVGHVHDGRRL